MSQTNEQILRARIATLENEIDALHMEHLVEITALDGRLKAAEAVCGAASMLRHNAKIADLLDIWREQMARSLERTPPT